MRREDEKKWNPEIHALSTTFDSVPKCEMPYLDYSLAVGVNTIFRVFRDYYILLGVLVALQ